MVRRRAFVLLPLVLLLAISAAALGVVYGMNAPAKQTTSAAYNKGNRLGPTVGIPLVALFFVWQAGRFAERRGNGSANAVFGGILLLMNLAVGINVYRVLTGRKAPVVAQRGSGAGPSAPAFPYTTPPPPLPQPRPPMDGQAPVTQPGQAQRPAPAPPAPSGPSPHEAATKAADAKARPVIEAFEAKLKEEITLAADAAEGFSKEIAKPPAHDKRVLKERTANADALRNALTRIERRLKDAGDDLEKELARAGLESFDARHRAMRWSADFSASSRQFAAGRLVSLCDRVKNECAVLDREFPAWTLTKGEITVRDAQKRHALTSERFFIEADVQHLHTTLASLREGR
ncbi:MAG TPA: hypothetical protein VD997_08770 [Phycisphaerales bacterium]|nr:hypothetical protein [Phycisphaerales bacterium]